MIYAYERIGLFVDGINLSSTAKSLELEIDFKSLLTHFSSSARLVRANYYTPISEHEDFQPLRPLVDYLDYNGWNVTTKPVRVFSEDNGQTKIKGNTTVNLTVDAMRLAPHCDHIVLFTGDGDFVPLVKHLQMFGTRVSVVSSLVTKPRFIADDLRRQADDFIELNDLRHIIMRTRPTAQAA